MITKVRSISIELTSDEARYILHALREFGAGCYEKLEADEEGDNDLTPMYADEVTQTQFIYEKIEKAAVPAFGKSILGFPYGLV